MDVRTYVCVCVVYTDDMTDVRACMYMRVGQTYGWLTVVAFPLPPSMTKQAYKAGLPPSASSSDSSSSSPLLAFLTFLLQTCERDAADLFQGLMKVYAPYLNVEPAYQPVRILGMVGVEFFGMCYRCVDYLSGCGESLPFFSTARPFFSTANPTIHTTQTQHHTTQHNTNTAPDGRRGEILWAPPAALHDEHDDEHAGRRRRDGRAGGAVWLTTRGAAPRCV